MATYINIIQGNQRLTDANKRQIEANRSRKEELDGQLRLVRDAREGLLVVRAQTVTDPATGRRQIVWVKQHPAAYRIGNNKIGHFWWIMDNEEVFNTGYIATGFYGTTISNVQGTVRVGIKRTSRLFCGDGSKSIEIVHGQQSQQMVSTTSSISTIYPKFQITNSVMDGVGNNDYTDVLILPSGNGSFIIVFLASTARTIITAPKQNAVIEGRMSSPNIGYYNQGELLTYSKLTQTSITRRCFVCSNSNIREISTPAAFSSLLDLIHSPTPEEIQQKFNILTYLNGRPIYIETTLPAYNWYVPTGFTGSTIAYTPDVFYKATQVLEDNSNATQAGLWSSLLGNLVKQFSSTKQWLIQNTANGAYAPSNWNNKTYRELFNSNELYQYGTWNTRGQTPSSTNGLYNISLYSVDLYSTLTLRPSRPNLAPASALQYPGPQGTGGDQLYAVWDWGDPAYCRTMCSALGFSTEDLTA